jgi:TnpA family transposase
LEGRSIDDAIEVFDVLMTNDLMAKARREAKTETLRRYPLVARDAAICAAVIEVLLRPDGPDTLSELWVTITGIVSRPVLAAAAANIVAVTPPPDADPGGEWREAIIDRYQTARRFLPKLCSTIQFSATSEAQGVLAAFIALPGLITVRPTRRAPAGYIDSALIDPTVVPTGWWHQLVYTRERPEGTVDRAGYVFCVLEQFHQRLRHREIFATNSTRWTDPRARLLAGAVWEQARPAILNALGLPEQPDQLINGHAATLDAAWCHAAETVDPDTIADGRLHTTKIEAIPDPASLTELRTLVEAMMPRVDLADVILDVMAWHPAFVDGFQQITGSGTRLGDLHLTVAAALTAHALNIGLGPVTTPGVPALTRHRVSHVDQNYLRPDTYTTANRPLIEAQADIGLARHWGGGLVAAADGIRFTVPVASVDARPNPKYFGRGRGITFLNLVNDQRVGTSGIVVSGTPRDSLHLIDLIYRQYGGPRPEVIITDTGSYSDIVFGLLHLLGFDYRPQLADLPDTKLWRTDPTANYQLLDPIARGVIDLTMIARHWPDILRIVGSIHTGAVSAHDIVRMLSRNGKPTRLGEAIASYGRIFKTLHVLAFIDAEPYRRQIKQMRNLQEGRHDLARHVFHGGKGQLRQAYREGMEDQLGALGLVLNCITLWNTTYLDAAITQLRHDGHPVETEDLARLSPYIRKHINVQGHYTFRSAETNNRRPLRDPNTPEEPDIDQD